MPECRDFPFDVCVTRDVGSSLQVRWGIRPGGVVKLDEAGSDRYVGTINGFEVDVFKDRVWKVLVIDYFPQRNWVVARDKSIVWAIIVASDHLDKIRRIRRDR